MAEDEVKPKQTWRAGPLVSGPQSNSSECDAAARVYLVSFELLWLIHYSRRSGHPHSEQPGVCVAADCLEPGPDEAACWEPVYRAGGGRGSNGPHPSTS